jgi:hypothetical protein
LNGEEGKEENEREVKEWLKRKMNEIKKLYTYTPAYSYSTIHIN